MPQEALNQEPAVSIVCMTFNQAAYIQKALDGFLMQETTFPFEILIHDDASADGTTDILKEYEAAHSNIHVVYEEENQYLKLPAGDYLKVSLEPLARGKYIAQCEGDDFWTDPHKLQRQFDYMEAHPDCLCCGHSSLWITADEAQEIKVGGYGEEPCDVSTEMVLTDFAMQTATLFYRRGLGQEFVADWNLPGPVTDTPWLVWLCEKGSVHYDPSIMSAYRWMADGSYSAQKGTSKLLKSYTDFIALCNAMNEKTSGKYEDLFFKMQKDHMIGGVSRAGFSFLKKYDPHAKVRALFTPKDWLYLALMQLTNRTWQMNTN